MLVFYFLVITTALVLLYRAKVQLFSDIRKYFRRKAIDYKQKAGFFIKKIGICGEIHHTEMQMWRITLQPCSIKAVPLQRKTNV